MYSNGLNFDYLKGAFSPAHFMKNSFGIEADEWQKTVLNSVSKRKLLLCGRQTGKSTVCASMALHTALYTDNALVLIVSAVFRQAQETFNKVKGGLAFAEGLCSITYETQTMLKLSNGSRIVCLPGKQDKIRSFSAVTLLIIDEAAQVDDSLYKTVRPMLSVSSGDLVALSTPFGKRGWFHDAWFGSSKWFRIKITAYECPRIEEEFLEEERQEIGDWWFRQEYLCEFVDDVSKVFNHDMFLASLTNEGEALSVGERWRAA